MKLIRILLVILTIFLLSTIVSGEVLLVNNKGIELKLEIKNAFYADYEGDGLENDVIAEYELKITLTKEINSDYQYILSTMLTLPSGFSFYYEFENRLGTLEPEIYEFSFIIIFWDHAIESGWYELTTGIELNKWGHQEGEMSIIFDPPSGGTEGVPPPSLIWTLN